MRRIPTLIDLYIWAFVVGLAAGLLSLFSSPARPHGWYPWECCSNEDCAPVEKMEMVPEGRRVTTRHGTVLVPVSHPVKASQDSDFHACMRRGDSGEMELICWFEPSGS